MIVVGTVLEVILFVFYIAMIVRMIASLVQSFSREWSPRGPVLLFLELDYSITDPPIKAMRKIVPPVRLGSVALDVAFILVFVIAIVLRSINQSVFL